MERCTWVSNDDLDIKYHDEEWGVPVFDDNKLFEFLVLESFQAGLSWITILKKREGFRKAFDNFDYTKIVAYDESKYEELINNPDIVRNKLKVRATINNAQLFIELQKEFDSFSNYIWAFVDNKPIQNNFKSVSQIPASTPLSDKISKDLKKRGFKFMGTTIVYAFMQAVGMVNDHTQDCFRWKELSATKK